MAAAADGGRMTGSRKSRQHSRVGRGLRIAAQAREGGRTANYGQASRRAARFCGGEDLPGWDKSDCGRLTSPTQCHYAAVSVHRDALPAADTVGGHAGPQHRGDAVFPRHNGTVTQRAAHIRNNA